MMKDGLLTEEYILPFVKAMQQLAEANGAYEKALQKVGTVEARLKARAGYAAVDIGDAGYTKGLINLYETLMTVMDENGATLTRIGKIYEKVFNGIANVVKVVTKWVEVFVRTLDTLWQVMRWGVNNPIKSITAGLVTLTGMIMAFPKLMGAVGSAIMAVLRGPLAVITAVMGAIDEVRSIFDENLIGVGENDKASAEDRKISAANARVAMSMGTKEDEALLKGLSKDRIRQAQIASAGPAQYLPIQGSEDSLSLTNNPVTRFSEKVGLNIPQEGYFSPANGNVILGSMIGFAKTSADYTKSAMMELLNMYSKQLIGSKSMGFNQTIIIQGNATDDSVQKIKDETRRVMEDFGSMNSAGVR